MKVCLTGASGHLGRTVYHLLNEAGFDVAATDMARQPGFPLPVEIVNLTDREPIYNVVAGADAVVHIGNHPNAQRHNPQRIYTENVSMNMHVFQAALESGVQRILFASSIQAMGFFDYLRGEMVSKPDTLPVPSRVPQQASNTYGLSKGAGEQMLDYYARMHGIHAVSLRFSALRPENEQEPAAFLSTPYRLKKHPAEFFSYCSFQRAARLMLALLERGAWEGHRVFHGSFKEPYVDLPVPELIRRFYPEARLTKPLEDMDALWDYADLEAFSGWDSSRLAHTEADNALAERLGMHP